MSSVATAVVASAVIGGYVANSSSQRAEDAARDATNAQAASADEAVQLQREQFNTTREDFAPFREIGLDAFERLNDVSQGNANLLEIDPGYQFRLDEGQKMLERSAAAKGGLFSGATGKDLTDYGQGLASQEYGAAYNRLAGLAGVGQTTTGQIAAAGESSTNNISNLLLNQGNVRASGYVASANAQNQRDNEYARLASSALTSFQGM